MVLLKRTGWGEKAMAGFDPVPVELDPELLVYAADGLMFQMWNVFETCPITVGWPG